MSTTRPEDGPLRGSWLRPVMAAVGSAAGCALLQGAVVTKIEPDAGWLQATAVLQGLTLPLAVAAGLLLARSCPSRARGLRGFMAGTMAGLGIFLVPALASFFLSSDTLPGRAGAWGALAVWILGCAWLLRSGPAQPGPAPRAFAGILAAAALGLGGLGLLLPGPAPAIGSLQALARPASAPGPNVALIVLDTLRADRLGCYGYERPTTPFLDELAARGLRFEAVHATASHTPPSHATLFTGLLPSETGVMGSLSELPWDLQTLAERLSDRGYTTAGVVANFVLRRARNYQQGFQLYDDSLVCPQGVGAAAAAVLSRAAIGKLVGKIPVGRRSVAKILNGLTRPRDRTHDAAAVTPLALRHLEEAARGPGPVFLFVNYMDVHTPY
ncbi:MAG: sulfatase-like hydrolase/transferase, partial [Planctomycetota bacterium]